MPGDPKTISVQTGPEGAVVSIGPLRSSFGNIAEAIGVVAGLQLQILGLGLRGEPEPPGFPAGSPIGQVAEIQQFYEREENRSLRALVARAAEALASARVRARNQTEPVPYLADCLQPDELELCLQVLAKVCAAAEVKHG